MADGRQDMRPRATRKSHPLIVEAAGGTPKQKLITAAANAAEL